MNPAALALRAETLRRLRQFFTDEGFLEVETPVLAREVIPELHIEPLRVGADFLQASPELYMKRLIADGAQAIYQVTRAFRAGERGPLHRPEFTMVEWYRAGDDMQRAIDLIDRLSQHLLQTPPCIRTSYRDAFRHTVGIDPHRISCSELHEAAVRHKVSIPEAMRLGTASGEDRDEWLNLLLATKVEPELGRAAPEILYHYPATQSSLATTIVDRHGNHVAERFELYWQGVELANGYHELTDAEVLRKRLVEVNQARQEEGRPPLPLPESLLGAMERGLPPCAGVALGFDRLVMLIAGAKSLDEVLPFSLAEL